MSQMIAAGQQPGVPFHVNNNGPQRPIRNTKKTRLLECVASIDKSSIRLKIHDTGKFSISFTYDALSSVMLNISFGVLDVPSPKEIK